ncbi:MAG TPA: Rrf2 family transcriptional regulator [Candidatus Woesebacteria bacterium]|nr:Rrf2 family transcriptional regulator [Candidatus Woesebacteria bacterium]HOY61205.1 Rrf2 family transcriptional regulator [Candidatus Woesebacteria bacterium]
MMVVSKKVEYSIVFISYLSHNKGKNITISQAAKILKLPYSFLGQVAVNLKSGGIIEASEGKSGGYRLIKSWKKKTLFDLFEALGENKAIVTCLGDKGCLRVKNCKMKKIWEKIEKSWFLELKKIKLGEI